MLAKLCLFFSADSCNKRHHFGDHEQQIFGTCYFVKVLEVSPFLTAQAAVLSILSQVQLARVAIQPGCSRLMAALTSF